MIDVVVSGAAGKMGAETIRAISGQTDMRVVAAVDPARAGEAVPGLDGIVYSPDLGAAIDATRPLVMVDFTHPSVVEGNVRVALGRGVHCVVGTTGLARETLEELARGAGEEVCLFSAPNFAIGGVLMMQFAAQAAKYLPHVEIIELHHDRKADAPSGTALKTAAMIAASRDTVPTIPGRETEIAEGARGAFVDGIPVHSVRLPGLVAHQEVLFGGTGQTLSIRHDSVDRTSFMPGVILAVRETPRHSGLVIGLEHYLEA